VARLVNGRPTEGPGDPQKILQGSTTMSMQSEVTRSYNSFSGSDIRASRPYPFAELQAVSYSVSREKAPIYTMGIAGSAQLLPQQARIAGSLIWVNFAAMPVEVFRKARGTSSLRMTCGRKLSHDNGAK